MALIYKQLSGGSSAPTIKLEITPKAYDIENNRTPIDYKFSIKDLINIKYSYKKLHIKNKEARL